VRGHVLILQCPSLLTVIAHCRGIATESHITTDGPRSLLKPVLGFTHGQSLLLCAAGTNYVETLRVQLHANCRIRRIYFSDRLYTEEELPAEFKLFLPVQASTAGT